MPTARTHAITRLVSGMAVLSILASTEDRSLGGGELLSAGLIGVLAALESDWMEPASHPHHRVFAHSAVLGIALLKLGQPLWCASACPAEARLPITLAMTSPLVLDLQTTHGLPFSSF